MQNFVEHSITEYSLVEIRMIVLLFLLATLEELTRGTEAESTIIVIRFETFFLDLHSIVEINIFGFEYNFFYLRYFSFHMKKCGNCWYCSLSNYNGFRNQYWVLFYMFILMKGCVFLTMNFIYVNIQFIIAENGKFNDLSEIFGRETTSPEGSSNL